MHVIHAQYRNADAAVRMFLTVEQWTKNNKRHASLFHLVGEGAHMCTHKAPGCSEHATHQCCNHPSTKLCEECEPQCPCALTFGKRSHIKLKDVDDAEEKSYRAAADRMIGDRRDQAQSGLVLDHQAIECQQAFKDAMAGRLHT